MKIKSTILVIEKQSRLKLLSLYELVAYKDLLYFLIVRGVKAKYSQSIFGVGWAVIQPLFTMLIFTVVFGNLAKISSDGIPYSLFSLCGLLAWTYFSAALSDASASLISNSSMISKVYFPRLILPLAALFSKLLDFIIAFIVLIAFMFYYQIVPTFQLIYFPFLLLYLLLITLGPSLIIGAWSVQYRDVKYAMTFVVQLLMYSAPVVYPLSAVPEKYKVFYSFNPLVGLIEGFRSSLLGFNPMPWNELLIGLPFCLGSILLGLITFSALEKTFADVA